MRRNLVIGALVCAATIVVAGTPLAQAKFGTTEEAKAMLMKAVAAAVLDDHAPDQGA